MVLELSPPATGHATMRLILGLVAASLCMEGEVVAAPADPSLTVEQLLKDGWDIAGYVGTADVRSTVILFRNKAQPFLVQCSTFYDVTRNPRVVTNCYQVR